MLFNFLNPNRRIRLDEIETDLFANNQLQRESVAVSSFYVPLGKKAKHSVYYTRIMNY